MSRVDEALRRAVNGPLGEARSLEARRADRRADDSTLDHYPRERREGAQIASVTGNTRARGSANTASVPKRAPGLAPSIDRTPDAVPFGDAFDGKLVASGGAATVSIEQYRRLGGAVHELQLERGLKTLMVTSALPREGKTLTVTNLALTLAGSYARRVLLIDADLRRPSVHEVLNIPNGAGLSDVLRSSRPELPVIERSPMLTVLPAGRAENNPMALLTSERMRILLEDAASRYDWVLLDAPPVGFMPDAGLLAAITGAVLFVIGAGSTPYGLVQRAMSELGPDAIVGCVLNRIDEQHIPASGYYRDYSTANSV